jgi:protein phosphatase 1G
MKQIDAKALLSPVRREFLGVGMGAYLTTPCTVKDSIDGADERFGFGVSEMQGWRKNMEDAHVSQLKLPGAPDVALFGVFDGHGGKEVSQFCAKYMPQLIAGVVGEFGPEKALVEAFHKMDEMLESQQYSADLEQFRAKVNPSDRSPEQQREQQLKNAAGPSFRPQASETEAEAEAGTVEGDDGKQGKKIEVGDNEISAKEAFEMFQKLLALRKAGDQGSGGAKLTPAAGRILAGRGAFVKNNTRQCALRDHWCHAGCTAVVALVSGNTAVIANAGDSRAILCRAGALVELSHDHKPNAATERNRIEGAGGFIKVRV